MKKERIIGDIMYTKFIDIPASKLYILLLFFSVSRALPLMKKYETDKAFKEAICSFLVKTIKMSNIVLEQLATQVWQQLQTH